MNPVFWVGVVAALTLVWFCLAPAFRRLGRWLIGLLRDAENGMADEKEE